MLLVHNPSDVTLAVQLVFAPCDAVTEVGSVGRRAAGRPIMAEKVALFPEMCVSICVASCLA